MSLVNKNRPKTATGQGKKGGRDQGLFLKKKGALGGSSDV